MNTETERTKHEKKLQSLLDLHTNNREGLQKELDRFSTSTNKYINTISCRTFKERQELMICDCIKLELNHSKLIIRMVEPILLGEYWGKSFEYTALKFKIILKLIKANAIDLDNHMELCVKEDLLEEEAYKQTVDNIMTEMRMLESCYVL